MRLIDADALLSEAKRISGPVTGDGWDNFGVYALIERQKTIDAVPVVRCRDCKKGWPAGEYVYCMKPYAGHWPTHKWDWYCADAERKEDAT